jgi:hypothetical protein
LMPGIFPSQRGQIESSFQQLYTQKQVERDKFLSNHAVTLDKVQKSTYQFLKEGIKINELQMKLLNIAKTLTEEKKEIDKVHMELADLAKSYTWVANEWFNQTPVLYMKEVVKIEQGSLVIVKGDKDLTTFHLGGI